MINLDKKEIDFLGHRKMMLIISACLVVLSIFMLGFRGIPLSSEFVGGSTITYVNTQDKDITTDDVREAFIESGYTGEVQTQTISSNGTQGFLVKIDSTDVEATDGYAYSVAATFDIPDSDVEVSTIGPNWGTDVVWSMVVAGIVALILVLLYISIRFRDLKMGVVAIVDMAFDLVCTLGILSFVCIFYNFTLSPAVVSSLMVVCSYSVYDLVVNFRAIEDTKDTIKKQGYMTIVNNAVNQVIVRTMNTTITTLVPVVMMLIFGGTTLTDFALGILVGILVGGFSTICFAVPVYAIWRSRDIEPARLNAKYGMGVNLDTEQILGISNA